MDERTLQALSRALTLLIFRNGAVEDLHASCTLLDDAAMKILNKDVNNRFYTILSIWFNGAEDEVKQLERTLNFLARSFGQDWDGAEYVKII